MVVLHDQTQFATSIGRVQCRCSITTSNNEWLLHKYYIILQPYFDNLGWALHLFSCITAKYRKVYYINECTSLITKK